MDIYNVIDNYLGKKPVPGAFPQKPDGFLSIYKLLSSGLIPNDNTLIGMFAMPSDPSMGYFYADSFTCRKMTQEKGHKLIDACQLPRPMANALEVGACNRPVV